MSHDAARLTAALADRYIVEREIGAGGMATVYLAQDIRHGRSVAMKVLHPELSAIIGAERFLAEIRTTAGLQHPHILPLFDSGTADGQLFYVMPFVEGETLRARLEREKQLPITDAVRISREVANALDYAHRRGIIHRDIKPENILLSEGQALVADFGIALAVQSAGGQRMTQTGLSLGTPQYMSPEQAMGERDITARSDVYSLGAVAYEMLAGEPPFVGPTAQAIFAKVMTEDARPLIPKRKTVPPEVEAAVLKAIEKLPADRFASAAEFGAALERPMPAGTAQTTAARAVKPTRMSTMRAAAPWLIGIAAAALAFVAGKATSRSATSGVEYAQKTFSDQRIFNARYWSDHRTLVFSGGSKSTPRIYVIRPEYPEPQPLEMDSAQVLSISSKGELAVLLHARFVGQRLFSGTLARGPLAGGAPRELIDGVREADWSPDGSDLAITRLVKGKDQLEFPAGKVLATSSGYFSELRFSPDGQRIAFFEHPFRYDNRGFVAVVDLAGNKTVLTSEESPGLDGLAWSATGKEVFFSARYQSHQSVVNAVSLDGKQRVVVSSAGDLIVQDVAPDGELAVIRSDVQSDVVARMGGDSAERTVGWLNYSFRPVISDDGSMIAFGEASDQGGQYYSVMMRRAGARAVRLGEGMPEAFTRDGQWLLSIVPSRPARLVAYPTSAGEEKRIGIGNVTAVTSARWSSDETGVNFCGTMPDKPSACYFQRIADTAREPVPALSVTRSPDGRLLLGGSATAGILLADSAKKATHPVPGTRVGDIFAGWGADSRSIWVRRRGTSRVERIDVATGRSLGQMNVPGAISEDASSLKIAGDGRSYVYQMFRERSQLFTVSGAR